MEPTGVDIEERVELVAERDFGCYDDDLYTNKSPDLPRSASRHSQRQPPTRAAPVRLSFLDLFALFPSKLPTLTLFQWDISELESVGAELEKMLLNPYEVVHWKAKPIEPIERFTRSTAVAERMEKAEKKNTTFRKRTMETNDYINEHFYMRKKHKTIKGDDWVVNHNGNEIDDDIFECDDDDDYDDGDGELAQIGPVNIENNPPENEETAPNDKNERPLPGRPTIDTLLFGDFDDDELDNSINVESLYGGQCSSLDCFV
ncbi:hypothetical protein KIN20_018723 [Parelaphostrongylus tenuis]|uniref:Uncharacterized protein n=1 Tax=Parelaphostrongylus tenuis TaxID=148309 RepID=A0AAD5N1F7_PARTN|nr:hypothetical protein KIN20_018723 [Parelaphostrongylus tenuis]